MSTETGHIDHQGKKMGMWFFLFTEILFFGGMFLLYSIFRYKYAQDFHAAAAEENLLLGTVNTVILLTSSYTIALSIAAVRRGEKLLSLPAAGGDDPDGARISRHQVFRVERQDHPRESTPIPRFF